MRQLLKNIIRTIFEYFHALASYIVPKKKKYYAFIPSHNKQKVSGNIRALITYANDNYKEIDTILIGFNKSFIQDAKSKGFKTEYFYLGIFWTLLRAEHIIIDATFGGHFPVGNFSLIQLWHGAGFKKVGLLNDSLMELNEKRVKQSYNQYELVIATSKSNLDKQNDCFGTDKTVITGYPRNDVFFKGQHYFNNIRKEYGFEKYDEIITYAPTFRKVVATSPFTRSYWKKLSDYVKENNTLFVVKKHPWDEYLQVPGNLKNIKDLTAKVSDVQKLLLISDMLITDYSSIATDYAITGRPILFYAYDFESYKKNSRSMYYDLEEVLPKPFIRNESELLEKIKNRNWLDNPKIKKSYKKFKKKFHKYVDGHSSKRVMDEILKL